MIDHLKFPKFDNTDLAKEKLLPPAKFDILFVTDVNIGYNKFIDIFTYIRWCQ